MLSEPLELIEQTQVTKLVLADYNTWLCQICQGKFCLRNKMCDDDKNTLMCQETTPFLF